MNSKQKLRRRGTFLVEAAASVAVLSIVVGLALTATLQFAKVQDHYHKRMAASWAAEAQMERYIAGAPIDSLPPEGTVAENISLETKIAPGTGQWEQFTLVTVTAQIENRRGKPVIESVRCFLPQEANP